MSDRLDQEAVVVAPQAAAAATAPERTKRRSPAPTLAFRAVVSAVVLIILALNVDFGEAIALVARADPWLLLVLFCLFLLERALVAVRWWMLLPDPRRVPFVAMFNVVMASNFLGLFLPGSVGFDALRIYGVSKHVSLATTLSSFMAERFYAVAAMLLLVLFGMLVAPPMPEPMALLFSGVALAGLLALALGVVLVMASPTRRLLNAVLERLKLAGIAKKVAHLHNHLDHYRNRPVLVGVSIAMGLGFQMVRVLGALVAGLSVGLVLGLDVWLAVMPIVLLVLLLPISFFGLGVRDLSLVYMVGLFGGAPEPAIAVGLLLALMTVLAALPGGWIFWRRGLAAGR